MSTVKRVGGTFHIRFAKEDFKFSSAHFTLFSATAAEALHGHNYRVWLELGGGKLSPRGLLVEFDPLKRAVRTLCADLDGRVLLPARAAGLSLREEGGDLEVLWRDRVYRFPTDEVVRLPLANTSIELLAQYLWERLVDTAAETGCETLGVGVEETSGQSCYFESDIPR
ncbi:MAG TPA: 6-carboxytetrahydropterin synthase [Thermoanaerobaculia bacterium]|nr:6-carboxytetrahydropterin synthase [Thermoanaerobaculia bacterium]